MSRATEPEGYWFKSSRFEIEPGEDDGINPGIYGRQLAQWLKQRLEEQGYVVEEVTEDWGRCLMCSREPYMLWVGCASATDLEEPPLPLAKEDIVWHCFVAAEVFFWKRLFNTIDTAPGVAKLDADLGRILRSEPTITFVDA